MLCKDCWIWKQRHDAIPLLIEETEHYKTKLLRQKRRTSTTEDLINTLDSDVNKIREKEKRLIAISSNECPQGACILNDYFRRKGIIQNIRSVQTASD